MAFQELGPGDYFANSHNIFPWLFIDFVGRKLTLVTLGSRVKAGCAKTFVRLSGTGRSLHVVRTCKPLTWLVCGTSTFLITKKKDCLQITVELKFILKVINTNLIQLRHSMVISFVFESSVFTIRFKSKTRVIMWLKTSNTRLLFKFQAKINFLDFTRSLRFRQSNLMYM